jgi:hypothetical protein
MNTPGPWEVVRDGSTIRVEAVEKKRGMRACGDPYPQICRMAGHYAPDEANARLIAVAPEMLEALRDEVTCLEEEIEVVSSPGTLQTLRGRRDYLQRTIDKASGKP